MIPFPPQAMPSYLGLNEQQQRAKIQIGSFDRRAQTRGSNIRDFE
jgi:hypothetical protein